MPHRLVSLIRLRRITATEVALLPVAKVRVLTAWGMSDQSVVS
jgi:hypothetical protein